MGEGEDTGREGEEGLGGRLGSAGGLGGKPGEGGGDVAGATNCRLAEEKAVCVRMAPVALLTLPVA